MILTPTTEETALVTQQDGHILIAGQPLLTLPEDLYIPPDALRIFLEVFTGPLDLLLYLIKKQNLDIVNIPIARITEQYLAYIELMEGMRFELAAEYLVMAAMLAEIKSRLLLPRAVDEDGNEEEDPRAQLIRRLQAYEQIKHAAERLDEILRMERDLFPAQVQVELPEKDELHPTVSLAELFAALRDVFGRAKLSQRHEIQSEPLSLRERMSEILHHIQQYEYVAFTSLFPYHEGRLGVVVTFIAILELSRQNLLEIHQVQAFSQIHVKARGQS